VARVTTHHPVKPWDEAVLPSVETEDASHQRAPLVLEAGPFVALLHLWAMRDRGINVFVLRSREDAQPYGLVLLGSDASMGGGQAGGSRRKGNVTQGFAIFIRGTTQPLGEPVDPPGSPPTTG
jgi:hypothetical protein